MVCAALRSMPSVRLRRFVRVAGEWDDALRGLCTQWQIQGWGNNNEVMVWTGAGQLVGSADDFAALVSDKYGINLAFGEKELGAMAAATQAAAEAEVADRKKFVRENLTEDGSMVKVLLIKPNQAAPLVKSVRESNWKSDMDALLGRSAVFSDSVELVSTETSRVMVWFNGDDAGAENQLATLALGGAQLLAQQCFRYSICGPVVFYQLDPECDTPQDYSSAEFDAHFETPDMLDYQQGAAATKIAAMHKGKATRAAMQEQKEQAEAATKIAAMHRGKATRAAMAEQKEMEGAATAIQSRFRGHKMREERREEEQAATRIQAIQRGKLSRKAMSTPAADDS